MKLRLQRALAHLLRRWAGQLDPPLRETSSEPPAPSPLTVPVKSHVVVPSSRENPRPLLGREKLREQLHLAHCCPRHGCRREGEYCIVEATGESPYFPCALCSSENS